MRTTLLTIVLFFLLPFCFAQTYDFGVAERNFFDSERERDVPVLIYYPSSSGIDGPVANSQFGFPVVGFGHGFVIDPAAYGWLGEELASRGYIVVLPQTEGQLLPAPDHLNFGRDIRFCAEEIIRLGSLSGNPLSGKVLPRYAMMGHSMGGGATYLGAAESSEVVTTVTFAAADTDPSSISAALNVAAPSLVIAAQEDCVTPVSTNQQPMYDNLPSSAKAFVNISGASHCNFTDGSASLCYLGEGLPCIGFGPFIERSEQHARILEVLVPWLDNYLKSQCARGEDFLDALNAGVNNQWWSSDVVGETALACTNNCGQVSDFTASSVSGSILLDWPPVEDALGYRVQARLGGTIVGSINSFENEIEIFQLSPDQPYEFPIRAFCPDLGFGDFSNWVSLNNGPEISVKQVGGTKAAVVLDNVSGRADLLILKMDGSPVLQKSINGKIEVLIDHLPAGLYLAEIRDEKGTSVHKFAIR